MAASVAGSAAKQLGSLLLEEAKYLYGVKDKVEELQQELAWMQVFLRDVDKKKNQDELIRMWVSQIRDFAYQAEDIVEKYIHGVSHHGRDKIWNTLTKQLPHILYNASALHEVASDIDTLTLKISKLNKRLKSYGVRIDHLEDSHYITRIRDLRQTYSNTVDKDLIKREEDLQMLVKQLIDENQTSNNNNNPENQKSNTVGIVGMGGLGKTTLAREVYRDKAVNDRFTHLVWIYISQQPQRRSILEETLRGMRFTEREDFSKLGDTELCDKISNLLGETRCLIVLDDIWEEDTRILKHTFQSIGHSKSKLLLTTRNEGVVHKMDPKAFILTPTKLSDEEGWMLLCKKALIKENDIDSDLKKVGEKMLKHCKGLPIAIVALGGILSTRQKSVKDWKEVEENIDSYLAKKTDQQNDDMGVGEVLELSYNELPFYLKPCFLYFGYFPENSEIVTSTLYQLWHAEGLVRATEKNKPKGKGLCMFDIAEQFLEELVKRCMVEAVELYENGGIKTCRMHDVMRDLCLRKSEEEKFLEVATANDFQDSSREVWTTHRVVFRVRDDNAADSFLNTLQENAQQLRSLTVDFPQSYNPTKFGVWFSKMCKAFILLRVLCLEAAVIKKLPDEVGSCIHLRYLSFRLSHESEVPSVVWKLNYLQTLDLRHNDKGLSIPNKLQKLKRLVHLYLPETYKVSRKLRFSQPRQMETLVNIDIGDLHAEDLGTMTNLRMLSFKNVKSMDSVSLSLILKSQIITSRLLENPIATISINAEAINLDPLMLGSSEDACIKALKINGMIAPSLEWIVFPRTIVSLELYGTKIKGDRIPDLLVYGLKELHLKENAIRGKKLVLSSESFPELKKLTLKWAANSALSEVEGTLPYHCFLSISCPAELEAKIWIALQQLQHNTNFQELIKCL